MAPLAYSLRLFALTLIISLAAPQFASADPAPAADRPKITKSDDLPRHTYPITGSVVDLVTSKEKFAPFAAQVRADIEKDLATYDIEDPTTLKGLKGTLLTLDLLDAKWDDARKLITELRALEDKPAAKLTTGFIAEVRMDVQDQTKTTDLSDPAFQTALEKALAARAQALPWNIVQDELKGTKAGFEIASRNLRLGMIQSQIDPVVKKTGSLSSDLARTVIAIRSSLETTIPLKVPVINALNTVIKAQQAAQTAKPDIWKDRAVTLKPGDKATSVVIAIWDSGVDPSVYPIQLFVDTSKLRPTEIPPGDPALITQYNGEDLHGIAFDLDSNRVHGDLYPLGDKAKVYPQMKSELKGLDDLESSIDSPEATALKQKFSSLTPDQVQPFMEDLKMFGNYIHGTHVAGIATEGNPFAQILIARITFDYHTIPEKPTVAQAKKDVAAYQTFVDYFKAHGVRVVNMSWGGSLKDVDEALEKNGVGDADERKKEAREIFDIDKTGLKAALASAPDILFICSAGNKDNDIQFDEMVPSSLALPNLITIGAVDQAGDETSFTSFGKNVFAYADGFEVESPIPGGEHLKLSGTSMSSPAVTNLAAKIFALKPEYKPADIIDLMKQGLEPNPNDLRILLLNPKKSVDMAVFGQALEDAYSKRIMVIRKDVAEAEARKAVDSFNSTHTSPQK